MYTHNKDNNITSSAVPVDDEIEQLDEYTLRGHEILEEKNNRLQQQLELDQKYAENDNKSMH